MVKEADVLFWLASAAILDSYESRSLNHQDIWPSRAGPEAHRALFRYESPEAWISGPEIQREWRAPCPPSPPHLVTSLDSGRVLCTVSALGIREIKVRFIPRMHYTGVVDY